MRNYSVFALCLQEMMDEHKLAQVDIAYALDVSPQYINDILRNRRDPLRTDQLIRLKHLYHFDLARLLIARAWSVKKIEVPAAATFKQVEKAVKGLMVKDMGEVSEPSLQPQYPSILLHWLAEEMRGWIHAHAPEDQEREYARLTRELRQVVWAVEEDPALEGVST